MTHPVTTRLTLLDEFRCLGGDCPANCCNEPWAIEIGPEILQKWQALPPGAQKERLLANIETREIEGRAMLALKKGPSGRCPHFRDDGLCDVHATLGDAYLGLDCRSYPRAGWTNGFKTMSMATLSCPEIARLTLAHSPDRSLFESIEDKTRHVVASDPTAALLDVWVDRVLTTHKMSLNVRLYYIAKTLDDLSAKAGQGQIDATLFSALAKRAKNELFEINLAVKNGRLAVTPAIAGAFWRFVYRAGAQVFDALELGDPVARTLQFIIQSTDDENAEARGTEIWERLQQLRAAVRPRLRGMAGAFENYLAVLFAYNGFPGKPKAGNYIATFTRPLMTFAGTQLLLALEHGANPTNINEKTVSSAIYRIERVISHNPGIFNTLERNPRLLHIGGYATTLLDLF